MARRASSSPWSSPPLQATRVPAAGPPGNGYRPPWQFLLRGFFSGQQAVAPHRHPPPAGSPYGAQAGCWPLLQAKLWSRRSGPPRGRYRALRPEQQPAARLATTHSRSNQTSPRSKARLWTPRIDPTDRTIYPPNTGNFTSRRATQPARGAPLTLDLVAFCNPLRNRRCSSDATFGGANLAPVDYALHGFR